MLPHLTAIGWIVFIITWLSFIGQAFLDKDMTSKLFNWLFFIMLTLALLGY